MSVCAHARMVCVCVCMQVKQPWLKLASVGLYVECASYTGGVWPNPSLLPQVGDPVAMPSNTL